MFFIIWQITWSKKVSACIVFPKGWIEIQTLINKQPQELPWQPSQRKLGLKET